MGAGNIEVLIVVLLVGVLTFGGVGVLLLLLRRGPRATARLCGRCRYELRGLREPLCPECGANLREVGVIPPGVRLRRMLPLGVFALTAGLGFAFVYALVVTGAQLIPWARQETRRERVLIRSEALPGLELTLQKTVVTSAWDQPRGSTLLAWLAGPTRLFQYHDASGPTRWFLGVANAPFAPTPGIVPTTAITQMLQGTAFDPAAPDAQQQLDELQALMLARPGERVLLAHWTNGGTIRNTGVEAHPVIVWGAGAVAGLGWLFAIILRHRTSTGFPPKVRTIAWEGPVPPRPLGDTAGQ